MINPIIINNPLNTDKFKETTNGSPVGHIHKYEIPIATNHIMYGFVLYNFFSFILSLVQNQLQFEHEAHKHNEVVCCLSHQSLVLCDCNQTSRNFHIPLRMVLMHPLRERLSDFNDSGLGLCTIFQIQSLVVVPGIRL